jgi:uncharacterized protein (DUF1800 family)
MATTEAFIATARFGLGARPGELAAIASDPQGLLKAQIEASIAPPAELQGLPSAASQVTRFLETRGQEREIRRMLKGDGRDLYLREAGSRTRAMVASERPFLERLVAFWSNHFTVSAARPQVLSLVGAFEREAIRPHALGSFAALLRAAVQHPAMLFYLDNLRSIGPNSRAGRWSKRGLNENLAREVLELHTLGVEGGYDQEDVIALAKILTGWSIARPGKEPRPGHFHFHARAHEPGAKTLLGRRYREDGVREGELALDALARHPATARHLALKLARHFIADRPPESAIRHLARVYNETEGDLAALAGALIDMPETWREPLAKLKTPQDLVVSSLRATAIEPEDKILVGTLKSLGQAPWTAPSPAGWPDEADAWSAPDALVERVEFAAALGQRLGAQKDPRRMLAETIAPVAMPRTAKAIGRAPSAGDGLTLLLASPEFQRR